jgi:hypothetical protein
MFPWTRAVPFCAAETGEIFYFFPDLTALSRRG